MVQSQKDIAKIIEHFDKYPLITKKNSDFLIWKEVFNYIKDNSNITTEGLKRIVAMKAHHNLGLSEKLKYAFPDVIAVSRPIVKQQTLKDLNWLAGFTTAEGSFIVSIFITKRTKLGKAVKLIFQISQHERDEQLMRSFIIIFGCGNVYKNRNTFDFRVTKIDDILNKIIPFFKKYKIKGAKASEFKDFSLVAMMIQQKLHLTKEGLEQIKKKSKQEWIVVDPMYRHRRVLKATPPREGSPSPHLPARPEKVLQEGEARSARFLRGRGGGNNVLRSGDFQRGLSVTNYACIGHASVA